MVFVKITKNCGGNAGRRERNCSDIIKAADFVHFTELTAIMKSFSDIRGVCHDVDPLVLDVKRI